MDEQVAPIDWSLPDLADAVARGVARLSEEDRLAQAVRGPDSLPELRWHAELAAIFEAEGYGVQREQRYPVARGKRRRSEGERCDFVLTPAGRSLEEEEAAATLFAPPHTVAPQEALWLEVKVVAQFTEEGPNRSYASDLQQPLRRDVAKLARESLITHAALLLILFTADDATAAHDLELWRERCLHRGLDVQPPYVRHVHIVDRLGNACCTLALWRVKGW